MIKDSTAQTSLVSKMTVGEDVLEYKYDERGNITEIKENGRLKASYHYDSFGQLTREDIAGDYTYVYEYDEGGNILSRREYNYSPASGEPLTEHTSLSVSYTYGSSEWKDLLTKYNGKSITYDAIGNPLNYRDGMSFTWSEGRRLTSADISGLDVEYRYNADGIRTYKNLGGFEFEYITDGTKILCEKHSDGLKLYFFYDPAGNILGFEYYESSSDETPDTYYYIKNVQGDVTGITDSTGEVAARYEYDAWGRTKTVPVSTYENSEILANINPIRYRSYYWDPETNFYYLNSRYYDPEIGRFINADSQLNTSLGILGMNVFSYCLNNPVNKIDCCGNKPGDLFDTMDEAARDFAFYINAKSIEENIEYASYIYTKTVWETKTITYYNPNFWGQGLFSSLLNYIFGGSTTRTVQKRVKVTKYTYRNPKKGTRKYCYTPTNWLGIHNKVAIIHTHGAFDTELQSDLFSDKDKKNSRILKMPNYIATPFGTLRKFDPFSGRDIVLYDDIPYDSNHPARIYKQR